MPKTHIYVICSLFGFSLILLLLLLPQLVSNPSLGEKKAKASSPTERSSVDALEQGCPTLFGSEHQRIGFNFDRGPGSPLESYDYAQLNAGWFHDYARRETPPDNIRFYQMVRPSINMSTITNTVGPIVDANPGAIWFLGNEPDKFQQQDNQTPAEYAAFYHDVYTFLKGRDPSAQVATAGVIQATPIRLAYLDRVLSEYESRYGEQMQIDIWTVHGFVLCETCGWGAGIPPGMNSGDAELRTIEPEEHIDIEIFKEQIVAMRQWMFDNGFQDKPLILNEYGILLPESYTPFMYPAVRDFMLASFDYLLTATDSQIGYAADGGRLVQQFAWFSLNAKPYDEVTETGHNGALFVHDTHDVLPWGLDFAQYVAPLVQHTDVSIDSFIPSPTVYIHPSQSGSTTLPGEGVTVRVSIANSGDIPAHGISAALWHGDPRNGGTVLQKSAIQGSLSADPAAEPTILTIQWIPTVVENGKYDLTVSIDVPTCNPERTISRPTATASIIIIAEEDLSALYLPLVQ